MASALVSFFFLVLFLGLGHEGVMTDWIASILCGFSFGWFILSIVRDAMVEAAKIIGGSIKVELSTKEREPHHEINGISDVLAEMMLLHKDIEKDSPVKKHKFRVGDTIIGNKKANRYVFTDEGKIGVVKAVGTVEDLKKDYPDEFFKDCDDMIAVFSHMPWPKFTLDSDCFDLYEPEKKSVKKSSKKSVKKPAKKTKK